MLALVAWHIGGNRLSAAENHQPPASWLAEMAAYPVGVSASARRLPSANVL